MGTKLSLLTARDRPAPGVFDASSVALFKKLPSQPNVSQTMLFSVTAPLLAGSLKVYVTCTWSVAKIFIAK